MVGAFGETVKLKHAHGAVPQDGPTVCQRSSKSPAAVLPNIHAFPSIWNRLSGVRFLGCIGRETIATQRVRRQVNLDSFLLGRIEQGQRFTVHVRFHQRAPDLTSLGLDKSVRHSPPYNQLVHTVQQVLKHREFRAHFGPTNHSRYRLLGLSKDLFHRLDLPFHQETKSLVFWKELGNHCRGSMRPVGRAKGIVDVEVSILGQLAGKEFIARLFLFMKAQVLEYRHLTWLQQLCYFERIVTDTVRCKLDVTAEKAFQRGQNVAQGERCIAAFWSA